MNTLKAEKRSMDVKAKKLRREVSKVQTQNYEEQKI